MSGIRGEITKPIEIDIPLIKVGTISSQFAIAVIQNIL
jgi:hypothetical protein